MLAKVLQEGVMNYVENMDCDGVWQYEYEMEVTDSMMCALRCVSLIVAVYMYCGLILFVLLECNSIRAVLLLMVSICILLLLLLLLLLLNGME